MTMEERFEAIMKKCEYLQAHHKGKKNQNAYLRRPLDVPKFEGRLDPDEFLEWLQAVERAFEFEEVPEDQKAKLVALKLRSFASLWWTHLLAKRVRQGKEKIRTWDKMKSKLKARFLPPTHLHKNYSQLHHFTPTLPTFDEVCMEAYKKFTKPLSKEQHSNKGSPSHPSKPVSPPTSFPQKDHAQNNHPPQNEPSPDLITPKQDEIAESVGEGELLVLRKAFPEPKEPLKDGGVLPPLLGPTPKPHFENDKLENLRTNSFLEGENDVNMGTILDQGMSNPSNQKSKALNQTSKGLTWLPKAPQTVVKTMVASGLLFVFDPGKGQL